MGMPAPDRPRPGRVSRTQSGPGLGGDATSKWLAGHGIHSGPGRVHPGQVVPRASDAHLDHVADHRLLAAPIARQLGLCGHTPAPGREPRTEHEGDIDEIGILADGAPLPGGPAQVAGGAEELRVGVTHVQAGEAALPELANDRIAGE
jgi:hypothetical protein